MSAPAGVARLFPAGDPLVLDAEFSPLAPHAAGDSRCRPAAAPSLGALSITLSVVLPYLLEYPRAAGASR